jgi:hypothetical protein
MWAKEIMTVETRLIASLQLRRKSRDAINRVSTIYAEINNELLSLQNDN